MKRSQFTEEPIIAILREQEAGAKTAEVFRRHGIRGATFCAWKAKFGGMELSEAKRLKALEAENARLKRLLAETPPDNTALKVEPLGRHWFRPNGEGCQKCMVRRQARGPRASRTWL